jgi:C4-dicarboxylate transporter DctQ subunit
VSTDQTDDASRRTFAAMAMRIFDRIVDTGATIAATLLVCIMIMTVVKVFFRYVLRTGLVGVDQISGTLLLYIAVLGAAWVLRREEHVIVDLVLGHVSEKTRSFLLVVSSLLGAMVCFLVAVFGTIELVNSLERGIRIPAEIEMPRAVNLIGIPIGFLLLALQFLRRALAALRDRVLLSPVSVA